MNDQFVMPLPAYLAGLEILRGNSEHLVYVLREHTKNLTTEALTDVCYALITVDQYLGFLTDEMSSAEVDRKNNIKLSQGQALMVQTHQTAMNEALEILKVHNIRMEVH